MNFNISNGNTVIESMNYYKMVLKIFTEKINQHNMSNQPLNNEVY